MHAENLARGEWLLSRVYCVLGRGGAGAVARAAVSAVVRGGGIGDWDLAYAYEALARASAWRATRPVRRVARAARWRATRSRPEDREHFDEDFATL